MASGAYQDHSEEMFNAMDKDNDGQLSVDDLVNFSLTPHKNRQAGERLRTALASENFSAEGIMKS